MKEEKESLLDINSVAGTRFEKATKARFAIALLRSRHSIYRLSEKDPREIILLMTPYSEGQGPEDKRGLRDSISISLGLFTALRKQYLKSRGLEVQRQRCGIYRRSARACPYVTNRWAGHSPGRQLSGSKKKRKKP